MTKQSRATRKILDCRVRPIMHPKSRSDVDALAHATLSLRAKCVAFLAMTVMFLLFAAPVYAACSTPSGETGEILYNAGQNVPQICTNSGWVALGPLNPAAGSTGCSSPTGTEGEVMYNSGFSKMQFCDGDNWAVMKGLMTGYNCPGPASCTEIGDQCSDTSVFAGCHPTLHTRIYVHPNEQSTASFWSTETVVTGSTSLSDGEANQNWVKANKTITDYPAFKDCDDLNGASALGYTDWFLPSQVELHQVWLASQLAASWSGTAFTNTDYWNSSELDSNNGYIQVMNYAGRIRAVGKATNRYVRCIRRE